MKTLVIARRELAGYFFSPVAYVIGAVFLLGCGVVMFWGLELLDVPVFQPVLQSGSPATLGPLLECMALLMVIAAPLLTMRLVSDEFRSGTIEILMTAPVTDATVILGKFLGVMGFYLAMLASTLMFVLLILPFGTPDVGVALAGYLGMILLGAAFLAVGLFCSTLTSYQIVSAIVGIVILAAVGMLAQFVATATGPPWNLLAARLNAMTYFRTFARGSLDVRAGVYFLSITAVFLFLSVKTLERRRWR